MNNFSLCPFLLMRLQFCSWVDGVILVFSLENEASFQEVYNNYSELCAHRNVADVPFIVVGTQGETRTQTAIEVAI